jgi:hypothetical protein
VDQEEEKVSRGMICRLLDGSGKIFWWLGSDEWNREDPFGVQEDGPDVSVPFGIHGKWTGYVGSVNREGDFVIRQGDC